MAHCSSEHYAKESKLDRDSVSVEEGCALQLQRNIASYLCSLRISGYVSMLPPDNVAVLTPRTNECRKTRTIYSN
jgi:hypothetical protein